MENENKVFSSNIIRTNNNLKNNLYDILNFVPIQPLSENTSKKNYCAFVPKNDKYYLPKKKYGQKVKTVREIRINFERDVYSYLPVELQKQRNSLLRRIRCGSAKNEKTKTFAKDMLKEDTPMLRSVWQMLMNINPEEHKFPSQYILWNGKRIQVNGSRGGRRQFICNYDVGINKFKKKSVTKNNFLSKKKHLLQHSLDVKFKPGPLTKKNDLDFSYQKYQFGGLQVVKLPKPGLDIQTCYNKPLAPAIDKFLQLAYLQSKNNIISEKWADFAVSVVGKNKKGSAVQIEADSCVTFDLNYNCFQHRLLMRHDSDFGSATINNITSHNIVPLEEESILESTISNMMDKILDSVEISLKQDKMYNGEDKPREIVVGNNNTFINSNNKNKRKFGELGRLDVTVIRISDKDISEKTKICQNDYCTLGCVCNSLKCSYNLKRHCGRVECMFNCKCDFSEYKFLDPLTNDCADIIPGLINLDKKLAQKLAKEEHKFRQTVIVTDEKSILLKSERRNWKTSKKYADFYSNMPLRTELNTNQVVSTVCCKIDCKNIEPWCMVHNLYKCFCKGYFTETAHTVVEELQTVQNGTNNPKLSISTNTAETQNISDKNNQTIDNMELSNENQISRVKSSLRTQSRQELRSSTTYIRDNVLNFSSKQSTTSVVANNSRSDVACARIEPYKGRKYSDGHYIYTNKKIYQMEKYDKRLHKKILGVINKESNDSCDNQSQDSDLTQDSDLIQDPTLKEMLCNVVRQRIDNPEKNSDGVSVLNANPHLMRLRNKSSMVAWLEGNYKKHKDRISQGLLKPILDAPVPGKLALYPWDFILGRYRERKNHFLISEKRPYRIFMVIDNKAPAFDNCINISDIALSELDKYPSTVKNLLTNTTLVKDSFFVLCGLHFCWELIGSVTKITENREQKKENDVDKLFMQDDKKMCLDYYESNCSNDSLSTSEEIEKNREKNDGEVKDISPGKDTIQEKITNQEKYRNQEIDKNKDREPDYNAEPSIVNAGISDIPISKWFLMTVENDFSEIQFYTKGFFVKYDSVIQAIDVARASGKTVRLSLQKCKNPKKDPQFGIYAIPSNECSCVFIGPYEKDEALGIETVKSMQNINVCKKTRGMWITTNEVDNMKVINNPTLFMPSLDMGSNKMVTLENDCNRNTKEVISSISSNDQINNVSPQKDAAENPTKYVKPIKIRKTNGFYHLAPNGLLKQIQSPEKDANKSLITKSNGSNAMVPLLNFPLVKPIIVRRRKSESIPDLSVKPVAEIATHTKESKSAAGSLTPQKRKSEGGMHVLKPAEINKRLINSQLHYQNLQTMQQTENISVKNCNDTSMDIENFLATPVVSSLPDADIFVISDEDDNGDSEKLTFKNVWIKCKNIESIGWIAGKKNNQNQLSFEFPGFKFSEFYPEKEAFNKINQVMARKIYVPKHINLEWMVIESEAEVKMRQKLNSKDLHVDNVLTNKGIRNKLVLKEELKFLKSTRDSGSDKTTEITNSNEDSIKNSIMTDLNEASDTLETEASFLWNKTMLNKREILQSLSKASEDLRKELTEQLTSIVSVTDE